MLNMTELTTICTNIQYNDAGDSGGGVMLQKGSTIVSLKSKIMNNTAKLNVYYDHLNPAIKTKEFVVGNDLRFYQTCGMRFLQQSQIEERTVYPYIDVKSTVYLEMYHESKSDGGGGTSRIMLQRIAIWLVLYVVVVGSGWQ